MSHSEEDLINLHKSQLENIFSNNKNQITEFAKKLEKCNYEEITTKVLECFSLKNAGEATQITSLIIAIAHNYLRHNEQWTDEINTSSLTDEIKENIREFNKALSEKTIDKLNLFYLSDSLMRDDSTHINAIGEEFSFKLIQDENGDIRGQLPVVSLNLITNSNEGAVISHTYTLTKKDLTSIINILNHISDTQNKLINNYAEKFEDTLVR